MKILVIGGSSQDAYFVTHTHLAQGDQVFATFRTLASMKWRKAQLQSSVPSIKDFFPIVSPNFISKGLVNFVKINEIDIIYYLSAVNLPRSVQVDGEIKSIMKKVHIDYPIQVLKSIIESPSIKGVFPLSSKMFSLTEEKDLIVTANSAPSPQNYYGETRALFWDQMRAIRERHSLKVLSPILFNHESRYRFQNTTSEKFVIQRLWNMLSTDSSVESILNSGIDLDAREDWLNAGDVASAISKLVEANIFEDIIVSSGKGSSIYKLLLDYFEAKQDGESFQLIHDQIINSKKIRPCLVGNNSRLSDLLGNIEWRIVLS